MHAKKLLITGAAGVIGSRLVRCFRAEGRELILIDIVDREDIDICADLADPDDRWTDAFSDIDAVVHLAADPSPNASQESCERQNVGVTRNVIAACEKHNVGRVVFASSLWTMQGYFDRRAGLLEDLPPRPLCPYGRSKAVSEEDLRSFGGGSLSLRIGRVAPDNRRSKIEAEHLDIWLSDRDLCQAFARAVDADIAGHAVLTIISANRDSPWSLSRAAETIGYMPRDGTSRADRLYNAARRFLARRKRASR